MDIKGKTYWLVGASEGLGRALAAQLDAEGAHLVLSARSAERLETLSASLTRPAHVVVMDLQDPASIKAAVDDAGQVDGVIFAAGAYEPMTAQQWNPDTAATVATVNFMGAIHLFGHLVPQFAARNHGHVVVIGSLAGYRGLPGAIGYGASKAGLMHLAENMRSDLWHTNVKVQLLNPGFIRTRLTDKNTFRMPMLMTPETAAGHVLRGMKGIAFKRDFPWRFSLLFRLGRFLPQTLFQRLFAPKP